MFFMSDLALDLTSAQISMSGRLEGAGGHDFWGGDEYHAPTTSLLGDFLRSRICELRREQGKYILVRSSALRGVVVCIWKVKREAGV